MKKRPWIFTILCVMAISGMFVGVPLAKPPASEQPGEDEEFDETAPDTPLPPGIKERVFIHLPRAHKPGHLGTCTETTNAGVNDYGLAGWRLPDAGITWRLNPATLPSSVGEPAAAAALNSAFTTWTAADGNEKFFQGPNTSVSRSRLDFVNAVLWGRISAGAIAITYVRYYTASGIVADVDTVFNRRYPWAVFDALGGECQGNPDAYDVQNIAVHEFGHWVGLEDLYDGQDQDLTMYGYGAGGELKKRTLGTGDITGVNAVAP